MEYRYFVHAYGLAQGNGCQRIGQIVFATQMQGIAFDIATTARAQPASIIQAKIMHIVGETGTETDFWQVARQAYTVRIITVHHCQFGIGKDSGLGAGIVFHALVAIHVVFCDIEDGGGIHLQTKSGFQLKAGQFQHIHIWRTHVQGIQHRQADIACHDGI